MEEIILSVAPRERVGSGPAGRVRREGRIPAVVYGVSGARTLSVDRSAFLKVWRQAGHSSVVTIHDDGGAKTMTLIQDVQRDPVTDDFLHVDLLELTKGHAITAPIPVHTHGTPAGVKNEGGVFDVQLHEVEVRCLPADLPHQIDVDVEHLNVGDILHIGDLPKLKGVEYLGDPEQLVASVAYSKTAEPEEPSEGEDAEPEIISEKKDEGEGEDEGSSGS